MSEIVWEDPAPAAFGSQRGHWQDVLEVVRSTPGEWARIRTAPTQGRCSSTKQWLRNASYVVPAEWEFTTRKIGDEYALYARFVGKPALKAAQ